MRVVLVAETFLPQMNGVVNSVIQVLRHLRDRGHEAVVIAPEGPARPDPKLLHGARLVTLRSVPAPSYPEVRVALATALELEGMLRELAPDVVHLASPFVLGWQALRAAERLGIPTVAVYQTDIPGYAERYGLPALAPALSSHVARIHTRATLTLAPSSASIAALGALGVPQPRLWARGVDTARFRPDRRDEVLRSRLAPGGEVLVGYVGRLAPEKQVADLAALAGLPGIRLVVIGDGPSRPALERALPGAAFLGHLGGETLAEAVASLDVFVHPGENETFCQTVQEALASGVPVVATGRGGPLDLVRSSRTGWLYRPGDLDDLRSRVLDLVGDPAKRRAFAEAARASVAHRSWASLGDELIGHYRDAARVAPAIVRDRAPEPVRATGEWRRVVALGDSLTEGMCDAPRHGDGVYRGWADRLATFVASSRQEPLLYANLAVRSRRIGDVLRDQIPRALELRAELATVLVGANDLVQRGARPERLAAELLEGVALLRASGADVLLIAPFAPRRGYLGWLDDRMFRFGRALRHGADELGATFLDIRTDPACRLRSTWAEDRVHLSSAGHRMLAYRAAEALGLPGAAEIGQLDAMLHAEPTPHDRWIPNRVWIPRHAVPWVIRRVRGRTAGDGMSAKHDALVPVAPRQPARYTLS